MPQALTSNDIARYKKMIKQKGKAGIDRFYAALRKKGYATGHWAARNYLFVSIDNRVNSQICLNSAKLGFFEYVNNESVGYREDVTFSDIFALSNKITVSFSPGYCSETNKNKDKKIFLHSGSCGF